VRDRISHHLRGNVVAYVALFVALSGGTAYALDGSNTVFSDDIVNGEIVTEDIGDGEIATGDLRGRSAVTRTIADGDAATEKLADGAVTPRKLACEGSDVDDVMVTVGPLCVDRYEASIWDAPVGGNQITGPIPCSPNGQDCDNIYARSVAGVAPTTHITWLQAQQALANSGKRLPTSAEWLIVVAGTPDSTDCNVKSGSLANTGAHPACVSDWGVNDMVGNLGEWVADWDEQSFTNAVWFSGDTSSIGRASGEPSTARPGGLVAGGDYADGKKAGPFKLGAAHRPWNFAKVIGFRGVRG